MGPRPSRRPDLSDCLVVVSSATDKAIRKAIAYDIEARVPESIPSSRSAGAGHGAETNTVESIALLT